jgi:hypothetical protein
LAADFRVEGSKRAEQHRLTSSKESEKQSSGGLSPLAPASQWLHRFAAAAEFSYWPEPKAIKK